MLKAGVFKAFMKGVRMATGSWKLSIYLWIVNTVFSLIIITPLYYLLSVETDYSLAGDRMKLDFDPVWFTDFLFKYKDSLEALLLNFLPPLLIYMVLNSFLNGGVLGKLYNTVEKLNIKEFISNCGKYWGRFFRLTLLQFPIYLLVTVGAFLLIDLSTKNMVEHGETEYILILVKLLKSIVPVALFILIGIVGDYAKIGMVRNDSCKSFKWFFKASKFVFQNLLSVTIISILNGLLLLALVIGYLEVSTAMPENTIFWILMVSVLQQLFITFRYALKLQFYGAGIVLFVMRNRVVL